ncbi:MAG: hypothetical protein KKH94_00220 [Candidatus Omnitrophica bacterium]|nr:hypothetical protein [Patescibacteria group bacterium]MBU1862077.1 hypothetical protein [Candidatus Omnitrophota bacterium]
MQKQKTRNIFLFIILIFVTVILFGVGLGFLYSSLPEHHPEKNEQSCEKAGGLWTDDQDCLLSYKKSGETCTDGGQCESGVCYPPALTDEQKNNLTKGPLEGMVGTCYPEELVTGCVKQVLLGTITEESMCLDEK